MSVPPWRSPRPWLALPFLALTLAITACGGETSPLLAHLTCTYHGLPLAGGNGEIQASLSCEVTGVTSGESAFTLTDSVSGAVCGGPVRQGEGSCRVDFITNTSAGAPGTVSGELLPSHRRLGPVAPALAP